MFDKYLPKFNWKSFSIEDPGTKLYSDHTEPIEEKMFIEPS
uniref:Uncharacterized protein n=1 Tax=Tetranychus urticae TaxID=32264 RepID=T1K6P7_TETUR